MEIIYEFWKHLLKKERNSTTKIQTKNNSHCVKSCYLEYTLYQIYTATYNYFLSVPLCLFNL